MNFFSPSIIETVKRLAEARYTGTTLVKWVNGTAVKVTPQEQLTIEEALKRLTVDNV